MRIPETLGSAAEVPAAGREYEAVQERKRRGGRPLSVTGGWRALEADRRSSPRGRNKPGERASATAPAYLHLFHLFCFLHPFFLFWFLFPVISFSCTRSAYNHYRVNFLRNCVVNLFLSPEYQAWNVLSKCRVNGTHRQWLPSLLVKRSCYTLCEVISLRNKQLHTAVDVE